MDEVNKHTGFCREKSYTVLRTTHVHAGLERRSIETTYRVQQPRKMHRINHHRVAILTVSKAAHAEITHTDADTNERRFHAVEKKGSQPKTHENTMVPPRQL